MFIKDFSEPAFSTINLVTGDSSVGQAGTANLNAAVDLARGEVS